MTKAHTIQSTTVQQPAYVAGRDDGIGTGGWITCAVVTVALLMWTDYSKNKKRQKIIDVFLHDTAKSEPRRRAELAAYLGKNGSHVLAQDAGMIQVQREKSFSWLIFIILCLLTIISPLFVLLAVLYLIWYWVQKREIQTFVLDI